MPQPSVCLNIPKTGPSFTHRFLNAADWLQFKRACGLDRLSVPNRASIEALKRIERLGVTYGAYQLTSAHPTSRAYMNCIGSAHSISAT